MSDVQHLNKIYFSNGNRRDSANNDGDMRVGTNNISSSDKSCALVSGNDSCLREGTYQILFLKTFDTLFLCNFIMLKY